MDRLAHLNINQYEIPGLVPGLLGLAIFVLGMALALRAVARGALKSAGGAGSASNFSPGGTRTMPLVFALTLTYALVLVGRGMPFWLGTFAFVASFIFLFDRERQTAMQRSTAKQAALALLYGAATSAIVSYAFEKLFLVRLP